MKKTKSLSGTNAVFTESMRYIDNAIDILNNKAKREGEIYRDKKYVKMAGHTAYTGILYALDNANLITLKKGQRADVKDYIAALAKQNKKMLDHFNDCYEVLHLMAGYDGYGNKKYLTNSIKNAEQLITWAANKA
jgi:hypothetical protein